MMYRRAIVSFIVVLGAIFTAQFIASAHASKTLKVFDSCVNTQHVSENWQDGVDRTASLLEPTLRKIDKQGHAHVDISDSMLDDWSRRADAAYGKVRMFHDCLTPSVGPATAEWVVQTYQAHGLAYTRERIANEILWRSRS